MKLTKLKIFKKIIKFIIGSALSLVLLTVISGAIFIYFYPKDELLGVISSNAEESLQRKIEIKDINYSVRGILLSKVKLYDGKSKKDPLIAQSEEVNLKFSLYSLIVHKKLIFDRISLKRFNMNITFDNEGKSNIQNLIKSLKKDDEDKEKKSTKISNIILENARINLKNPPKVIAPLEGVYICSGNFSLKDLKNIVVKDCNIQLPQKRGTLYPDVTISPREGNFKIVGKVKVVNTSIVWTYGWAKRQDYPWNIVNGNITNLHITRNFVKGHANATCTLRNYNKNIKAIGKCHVDIRNRKVIISKVKGKIGDTTCSLNALVISFDGNPLHFNISDISANIGDVKPILKFLPKKLSGKVFGNIAYKSSLVNGKLKLQNVNFDKKNSLISGLNTQISIRNSLFKKTNIPVTILNNPCLVSIASTDSSFKKLFINIRSKSISLSGLKFKTDRSPSSFKSPIEIKGTININELKHDEMKLSNLQLNYSLSGKSLNINGFSAQFFGGAINGNGSINIARSPARASLAFQFENLKVQNLTGFIFNKKFKDRFFGEAYGKASIQFNIKENIYNTLAGKVEFNVRKGKLVNTGIQSGLGVWLSELKYKLRDLEFRRIYGNIALKGTNYVVNSFIFNAQNIRLKIEGSLNKKLIARPLLINLEFNKHFIEDLPGPVALGVSKYRTGNWYVIPFACLGDITDSKNIKRTR